MTRLCLAVLATLALPAALGSQDAAPAEIGTPFLAELAIGPSMVSGGRAFPPGLAMYLASSWVGVQQKQGYRLGAMASSATIGGPLPRDPSRGMVRERTFGAFTLERIRLRKRGNMVVTTGYGVGLGTTLYYVDQSRSGDSSSYRFVQGTAPAIVGSVDVAFRVPPTVRFVVTRPFDFYVGLRSSLLFGAPSVGRTVPTTGEIPTSRGLSSTMQLIFGARFGVMSQFF